MPNRKDIKSGSVWAVPLEKNYGYAYAKLIFANDLHPKRFDTIIKIYDLHTNEILESPDRDFFESDSLLFFPWLTHGEPPLRGQQKWILLGYASLTDEDWVIPDYIDTERYNFQDQLKKGYPIYYVRNLWPNKRLETMEIKKVNHLGEWHHLGYQAMVSLLTMHFAKKTGKVLKDIYSESELEENFWLDYHWRSLRWEPDINLQPKLIRLRALE